MIDEINNQIDELLREIVCTEDEHAIKIVEHIQKIKALHAMGEIDKAVKTADAAVAAVGEQTTCPVMGGAINKDIFTEYKGKKVYFCCAGCDGKFKADPEKYLSKLPQFKE